MKYFYILFFIILFIFSCTNDDDSQILKEKEPIELTTLPVTNESLYSLELNADFKIDDINLMTEYGFIVDTIKDVSPNKNMKMFKAKIKNNKLYTLLGSLVNNKTLYIKSYAKIKDKYYFGNEIEHKLIEDNVLYIEKDLIIDSQEKLNELAEKKYTSIRQRNNSSSLIITGNVNDISGLNTIEILELHFLRIEDSKIENLNGFNKLKSISSGHMFYYGVSISNNKSLKKIEGFEEFMTNYSALSIYNNPNLETINSFNKLHVNYDDLQISKNPNLRVVDSFKSLSGLSRLFITENDNLITLNNSFEKLELAVYGTIISNNKNLSKINNFKSLKKTEYLNVENNKLLDEISFPNLETVNWAFNILYNDNLTKLSFPNFKRAEYINFESNNSLINLDGIKDVETDYLFVKFNNSLKNLTSFKNVKIQIHLYGNPLLNSLKGFENVKELKGTFDNAEIKIINNNSLEDLSGLDNLKGVYGVDFSIFDNKNLKSLKGLNNLTSIKSPYGSPRSLSIYENPKLSEYCAIKKFVSNPENNLDTKNNLYNPTIEDILKNCK